MNRFKTDLPTVIRPDILLTNDGLFATELDSIPGGIGFTGNMCQQYSQLGYNIVGGENGMIEGFAEMIRDISGMKEPTLTIVVSEESKDYRDEMKWLGEMLNKRELDTS